MNWNRLQKLAEKEIERTLSQLPRPLRERAEQLPVVFEEVPGEELQADGIEADTLGFFTGAEFADHETILPAQITLFLRNLWEFVGGDEAAYCDEVRTTFLHELGHFLGLDEDDLIDRGLE